MSPTRIRREGLAVGIWPRSSLGPIILTPSSDTEASVSAEQRKPLDSEIDVFGMTDRGKVRSENQDHFLVCSLHKSVRLHHTSLPNPEQLPLKGERLAFMALVADGVGSHKAGEKASRLASESVAQYVSRSIRCYYTENPSLEQAFLQQLYDSVMQTQVRSGCTTMTRDLIQLHQAGLIDRESLVACSPNKERARKYAMEQVHLDTAEPPFFASDYRDGY